jgi:hypothetical protein
VVILFAGWTLEELTLVPARTRDFSIQSVNKRSRIHSSRVSMAIKDGFLMGIKRPKHELGSGDVKINAAVYSLFNWP